MIDITDQQVREVASSEGKPHLQEPLLRFLIRKKILYPTEAAEVIQSAFEYDVSRQQVQYGMDKHGISKPAFHDVIRNEDTTETEEGQPPRFLLERSDESPTHPLDTDCFDRTTVEGGGDNEFCDETLLTAHYRSPSQQDSTVQATQTPDSPSDDFAGVLKGCPWRVSVDNREHSLIAPPHRADELKAKYQVCGCNWCPERTFLDGTNGAVQCDDPLPTTIAGAREIYRKTEGCRVVNDVVGNDVQRGKEQYGQVMRADSAALSVNGKKLNSTKFRRPKGDYDDITTVLLSLRLTNTDSQNRLITPHRQIADCMDSWAEARSRLPTDANSGLPSDTEHIAYHWLHTGTDDWGSVHVHCYLWYADPQDTITRELFKPAVSEFVERASFPADCHLTDDGELVDGCVRVENDPLLADPERMDSRIGDGAFDDVISDPNTTGPKRITDGSDEQSAGAIYQSTQLPKLALSGTEPDSAVEFASFIDAMDDDRNAVHGGGDFYLLARSLEALTELDREQAMTG